LALLILFGLATLAANRDVQLGIVFHIFAFAKRYDSNLSTTSISQKMLAKQ